MIFAISPYDLSRDSPALLAGALLGEQLVTLLPAPLEGASRGALREAIERHPHFLRYIESSRWLSPLWHANVLSPGPVSDRGAHAAILDDARAVCARVASDDSFAALRGFVDPSVFESTDAYLAGLSQDLLRAGVSPGFVVTVAAAVDRFAARHRLPAIRSETASKVGDIERRSAKPFLRLSMPVTREADGDSIMDARLRLTDELGACREALVGAVMNAEEVDAVERLRASFGELEDAFSGAVPEGSRTVVLSVSSQPADRTLAVASKAAAPIAKKVRMRRTTEVDAVPVALDLPPVVVVSARYSRVRGV